MDEMNIPPSPSWFLPNILASREDGSLAYGSRNHVVILKIVSSKALDTLMISNAHKQRVTSVAFSPMDCHQSFQNTIVSCSEDGLVKLWKIDTLTAFIGHDAHWTQNEAHGKVVCLDWSVANPHHIVSAADNNSLVLWDVLSNTSIRYSFQRLISTVIACCPHNEKLVAVGAKSGLINIVNLSGSGEIIYKLRGHDNEIQALSWCPTPYNVFKMNEICEEFLLASSCQNKEVFIWRAGTDGKCEISIQTPSSPQLKKDSSQFHGKLGNSFNYLSLLWHSAYKLFLSSSFGELLIFDVESYLNKICKNPELKGTKQKSFTVGHNFHSRGLYAIASKPITGNIVVYEDCEMKSELRFKIDAKSDVKRAQNADKVENFKWKIDSPEPICLLWTASQDRKLVASKFNGSNLEIVFNLSTLNGGVCAIAPSPHDPNKVAFGGGDGLIRVWNLLEPSGEMQVFWQKIKDRVMSLAWHPTKDGLLAYGTSEGRIGLMDINTNKMPYVFKPNHSSTIYGLSWGPQPPLDDSCKSKKEFRLYCVGDNTLSSYNISNIKEDPLNLTKSIAFPCKKQTDVSWKPDYTLMAVGCDDGTIYLVEPVNFKIVHTLFEFKKTIYSIAWHPNATSVGLDVSPYHTYFAVGSTDNENAIGVFNCEKEEENFRVERVALLKGHHGHILSVAWSTHLDCRLLSSSADGSVQVWDVIAQVPLANFTPAQKPNLSVWSPVNPDFVLTGCHNGILSIWKISNQTKTSPSPLPKTKKPKKGKENEMTIAKQALVGNVTASLKDGVQGLSSSIAAAEPKNIEIHNKEPKMFSRAWKASSNHDFNRCYSMLKTGEGEFSLPFLNDDDKCNELQEIMTMQEEKCLRSSNNLMEYYEMCLWNGKIKNVIEERIQTGQLDDFLVSLAPMVSFRLWQDACIAYSKTLIEKNLFRKAATYLIGCHKIYEGINLLLDQNLYLEALYISSNRLPKSDSIFEEIVRRYAQWLFNNGSYLKACECYLYLKDYSQVMRVCGKKGEADFLSLAALAARRCGLEELEIVDATRALLKCFELNNFELGRRICEDHDNLKHLKLLYCTYETLCDLDSGKLKLLSDDVLSHVRKSMDGAVMSFPSCIPQLYQHHKVYKNKQEMFVVVAQELSMALCCNDQKKMIAHVIKALCTCCRFVQSSESQTDCLFKLNLWLSPGGVLSSKQHFGCDEEEDLAKRNSLREFVGAAIVREVNCNPSVDNILSWINTLHELEDSFLNENSFKYFKNLMNVGMCEKRLMSSQSVAAKEKLPVTHAESGETKDINGVSVDCSNGIPSPTHEENGIGDDEQKIGTVSNIETNGYDVGEKESPENDTKCVKSPGEKNLEDKDLLNKLRSEISDFQRTKISAPNPVPVFFMLKKICAAVPESETGQILLSNLESKWLRLN